MRIALCTPVALDSTRGNSVTARRWAGILEDLGHEVLLSSGRLPEHPTLDLALVLHARKGAAAVREAVARKIPVLLCLTGTDLYADLPSDPDARGSCAAAWRILTLHGAAQADLPEELHSRVRLIHQSVPRPAGPLQPPGGPPLQACVLAHLREVKAPLLPAQALQLLEPDAPLRLVLAGAVLEAGLEAPLHHLLAAEPRFHWAGALSGEDAAALLDASDLLVLPSRMEGGANVISEAAVRGLPILASDAAGNTGLLGAEHPGCFAVGDVAGLAGLYRRVLSEPAFLTELRERSLVLAPCFDPARERRAWEALLAELRPAGR